MPSVLIDGKEIIANPGEKVLWVALRSGIYIPHLCAIEEAELPFGGCRLCLVELELDVSPVLNVSWYALLALYILKRRGGRKMGEIKIMYSVNHRNVRGEKGYGTKDFGRDQKAF